MLVERRDTEGREEDDEHEDVVHRQRLLENIPGSKLEGALRTRQEVHTHVEHGCETNPHGAPGGGLLETHLVGAAVENAEVDREHRHDEGEKGSPEGPGTDCLYGHPECLLSER